MRLDGVLHAVRPCESCCQPLMVVKLGDDGAGPWVALYAVQPAVLVDPHVVEAQLPGALGLLHKPLDPLPDLLGRYVLVAEAGDAGFIVCTSKKAKYRTWRHPLHRQELRSQTRMHHLQANRQVSNSGSQPAQTRSQVMNAAWIHTGMDVNLDRGFMLCMGNKAGLSNERLV